MLGRLALSLCAALLAAPLLAGSPVSLAARLTEDDGAWITEVKTTMQSGDFRAALEQLEVLNATALSSTTARSEQQKLLGQVYIRLEDYDAAIAALTNVIDFPRADRTSALINRCHAYLQVNLLLDAQQDCSEARSDLELAQFGRTRSLTPPIVLDYRKVSFAMVDAELFMRSGQSDAALDTVSNAIRIVESNEAMQRDAYWSLYLMRARILGALGKTAESVDSIDALIPDIPERERHLALAARAETLRQGYDIDAAVADWKRASDLSEDRKTGLNYLFLACAALLQNKERDAALEPCGTVAREDPSNGLYAEAHALALLYTGGIKAAAQEMKNVGKLRPRTNLAIRQLDQVSETVAGSARQLFRNGVAYFSPSTPMPIEE